jgi:flavin-dependent dehydrogenase
MSAQVEGLGPLRSGQTVAIIGGGPAGASCAIALLNAAQTMGVKIEVVIYEGKDFSGEFHHNQCVGVLSPPLDTILSDGLGVAFPMHLVQRTVTTYVLHSDRQDLDLEGDGAPAHTVSRVRFDDYLLWQARSRGARLVRSRVTDLEFFWDRVIVYAESESRSVDVVVAAFGLDEGSGQFMLRATGVRGVEAYRPPD